MNTRKFLFVFVLLVVVVLTASCNCNSFVVGIGNKVQSQCETTVGGGSGGASASLTVNPPSNQPTPVPTPLPAYGGSEESGGSSCDEDTNGKYPFTLYMNDSGSSRVCSSYPDSRVEFQAPERDCREQFPDYRPDDWCYYPICDGGEDFVGVWQSVVVVKPPPPLSLGSRWEPIWSCVFLTQAEVRSELDRGEYTLDTSIPLGTQSQQQPTPQPPVSDPYPWVMVGYYDEHGALRQVEWNSTGAIYLVGSSGGACPAGKMLVLALGEMKFPGGARFACMVPLE